MDADGAAHEAGEPAAAPVRDPVIDAVVEWLTFRIDPAVRDAWLDVEAAHWSEFLRRRPGMRRKEVWVERADPWLVHVVVHWDDEQQWRSIPVDELQAVDEAMGAWFVASTLRVFDVVRSVDPHRTGA